MHFLFLFLFELFRPCFVAEHPWECEEINSISPSVSPLAVLSQNLGYWQLEVRLRFYGNSSGQNFTNIRTTDITIKKIIESESFVEHQNSELTYLTMNSTEHVKKNRHTRNDESQQSDGNEGSDGKDDDRNRSNEQENENSEQRDEHDLFQDPSEGTSHNDQNDNQNKESASSDGSKRVSPVHFEEREPKKTTSTSSYKPPRRYPTRDSLLNRHRDLSQENKRLLASTVTRNSSLAPLLREGGGLGGILGDIPDYYTDEVTVQFLNAQVRSLKEELETLIRECVDKDEMIILLEQRLKDTEIDRSKLQRENSNKEQQETDILKQGQRQAASMKSSLETKLSRSLEENERFKTELRQAKQSSKEAQENYQRKMEELSTENRRIDKQNAELHNAIKKQMQLINNLKTTKVMKFNLQMHVEAATAVQFSEEEFMKALDRGT
ncbi:testis-expressed protein 9 [Caerostris extrusa]|uniref:Testis-expressed protein 9 n=1 Tax=Caerostris extrusa TaxID=172846 RepID=A0AAV4X5Y0_CAEEX|nr:testis-expressed protein 9 [Caerostris extrusa]